MAEQVKLKRRHIKEDKFADFVLVARHQLTENWQMLVIGLVVVALLVAGAFWFMSFEKDKQMESATVLSHALMEYRSGNFENAVAGMNQVITDNNNANAVQQAVFMLGSINLERKNYAEATRYFEQYVCDYKDNKLHLAASLAGIALSMESQSQFAQAADKYLEAIKVDTTGALADEYHLSAMRNYIDAGNAAAAKEQLDYIKAHYEGTSVGARAEMIYAQKMKG